MMCQLLLILSTSSYCTVPVDHQSTCSHRHIHTISATNSSYIPSPDKLVLSQKVKMASLALSKNQFEEKISSRTCPKLFLRSFVCVSACLLVLQGTSVSAFTTPSLTLSRSATRALYPYRYSSQNNIRKYSEIYSMTAMTANEETSATEETEIHPPNLMKTVMNVYIKYIKKLWRQTDPIEREKVAAQQALAAVKRVKNIMEGEEYVDMAFGIEGETLDDIDERITARDELKLACSKMLHCLEKVEMPAPAMEIAVEKAVAKGGENAAKKKKKSRSVLFGASMGLIVACWVFSGNFLFTAAFTFMTALGQLEYYRMVMKTGIYPARRISVVGACSMFLTVSNYYILLKGFSGE